MMTARTMGMRTMTMAMMITTRITLSNQFIPTTAPRIPRPVTVMKAAKKNLQRSRPREKGREARGRATMELRMR